MRNGWPRGQPFCFCAKAAGACGMYRCRFPCLLEEARNNLESVRPDPHKETMKSLLRVCASLAVAGVLCSSAVSQARWLPYGPDGGDARAFASDPHDHNHIFLGTVSGTIYDTHDGGHSWKRLAIIGNRDDLVIDNILVDPLNASHVFAGGWVLDREDGGLYVSNDAGKTWVPNAQLKGRSVRSLTVAPSDPKLMVLGTLDGVYRSTDSGATWTLISPPGSREIHEVESVAIDPKNPNWIMAGTWHLPWKTTDGGQHWSNLNKLNNGIIDDSDVFSIIVDPTNASNVFLSACSGIYRSTDQGVKFEKVQGIPATARRTRVLMEDPKEPGTVFAGTTEGLWRTSDSGHTFVRHGDASWIINDINIDAQNSNRVLLATDREGVLMSNDGGLTFTPANAGFSSRQVSTITTDRSNSMRVYAGVINDKLAGGVFASEDGGLSWTQKSAGLGGADIFSLAQAPDGTLLAGTRHGIYRMTGGSWQNSGLTLSPAPDVVAKPPVARTATRPGTGTPQRASQRTGRYVAPAVSTMAPPRSLPPAQSGLGVFAMASNDSSVFAGTEEGLLRSGDNGNTWSHVRSANAQPWRMVSAQGARVALGDLHKLAISTDGGVNFLPAAPPTELTYITSIAVDDGGRFWVGGREGIWVSENEGVTWHSQPNLFVPNVSGIYFDRAGSRVIVTSNRPSTLIFTLHTPDMKVTYKDSGWGLRMVRPVGDHMIGVTPFDGVVVEPRMVVSKERPLSQPGR